MNAITKFETNIPALLMPESELLSVLRSSLYPGAKDESIKLVIGYCKAAGLDPMLKPVHIVPMTVKTGQQNQYGDDIYEKRDTIMPGIGLYRIQAARTGEYAGMDKPVFGPMKELEYRRKVVNWVDQPNGKRKPVTTYVDAVIEYPEWVEITVYRLVGGVRCPFTAVEYWLENYATAAKNVDAPNEMWERRTRAQLCKCTEAQALRRGFPEIGSAPTADEMEGRDHELFVEAETATQRGPMMPRSRSEAQPEPDAKPSGDVIDGEVTEKEPTTKPAQPTEARKPDTGELASVGERNWLTKRAGDGLASALKAVGAESIETLTKAQFVSAKSNLMRAA